MNTQKKRIAALVLATGLSGAAQAALHDRGGGLIYDDILNVTWLQDANYAKTTGHSTDGYMSWHDATAWAANLSYYDSVRNVTYDDWRLPTTGPVNGISMNYNQSAKGSTDYAFNISALGTIYAGSTGNEMAHLFYNSLANTGYCDSVLSTDSSCLRTYTSWDSTNPGPFSNLQTQDYWSGTQYLNCISGCYDKAWYFHFGDGFQAYTSKVNVGFSFVVRNGDVAAVPEPETYAMMLAGLGLVGFMACRRKA